MDCGLRNIPCNLQSMLETCGNGSSLFFFSFCVISLLLERGAQIWPLAEAQCQLTAVSTSIDFIKLCLMRLQRPTGVLQSQQ